MGDVRLFSLALMHVHYDKAIEVDELLNCSARNNLVE